MKSERQILKDFEKRKRESKRGLGKQRENTRLCRAFRAGDYMEYKDKIQVVTDNGQKKRVTVQINKVKPYHAAVKGFLAQNRRKPDYIAKIPSPKSMEFYSKYANRFSDYLRKNMNAPQVETQQDGDMLEAGLGVINTAMSYGEGYASRSANGEVIMTSVDLDTYWYDPTARETNLLDRRYDGITKQYHIDDALDLFDDSEEGDFEHTSEMNVGDYQQRSDLGAYDRIRYDWSDRKEGMVNVDFYYWYDIEPYYRANNPISELQNPQSIIAARIELERIAQEVAEDDEDFDPRADILSFSKKTKALLDESFGEFIEPEEFRRKVFYTGIISGKKVFTKFRSEHQEGFSIKVKTGDYDSKNKIWTGMINSMMEPQKYYNKALTELMFVIAANSKGGVLVEEDAVEDIEEFEENYAKTDGVCVLRSGANAAGKIKDKKSPFAPTGYEQVIQFADAAIADVTGIDRTFLGSSENRLETAALQRARIKQITASLAIYMDSVVLYTIEHARLMMDFMRIFAENNRGESFPSIGDDGVREFIEISEDKLAVKFEIDIQEAPTTQEERHEMAAKLTLMGDKFLAAQQVDKAGTFYALAAKYMSLDNEDLQQLNEILVPEQQQIDPQVVQQMQAEIDRLNSELTQAQVGSVKALTQKTLADAAKSASEIELNAIKESDLRAGIHKKAAETTKTLEDAEQTSIENEFTKRNPQTLNPQKS